MRRAAAVLMVVSATAACAGTALAQSQADMNVQAGADYKVADRALNAAYAKVVAQASPDGRIRVRTAQRDWIRFRESDCAARAGSRGGSFYPTTLASCLAEVTRARTATLEAEAACEEGDMGCGGHRED